jgi:hypothetical protein
MVSTASNSSPSRAKTRSSTRHLEEDSESSQSSALPSAGSSAHRLQVSADSTHESTSDQSALPLGESSAGRSEDDVADSSQNATTNHTANTWSPSPTADSRGGSTDHERSQGDDVRQIRSAMTQSKFFLGNPDIAQHVEWIEAGRQRILVEKEGGESGERVPAVLEWIGEISSTNYWLYACAGWNGERGPDGSWNRESPFEKAKARGQIRRAIDPLLAEDWDACIVNMRGLMDMAKTNSKSPTALSTILANEIKIRHSIFEVSRCVRVSRCKLIVFLAQTHCRRVRLM